MILFPKIASPQTVIAIFLSFGQTMSRLLFLHQALELLFLEELFASSKWAAGDYLRKVKWALCQQDQNLQHYQLLVGFNDLILKSWNAVPMCYPVINSNPIVPGLCSLLRATVVFFKW